MLLGKKIVLGITGGIAAYKIPSLIRLLRKEGCEVKTVCTEAALQFVTPLTLECLSQNKVYHDLFDSKGERSTQHISYAQWGDVLLIAPATANILAKMAHGLADDALSTLCLAFPKGIGVVPAMNVKMYEHPATQENLRILRERGVQVLEPEEGHLACGVEAKGRMVDPEGICRFLEEIEKNSFVTEESLLFWKGKKVLLTAGPTQEDIDPVRFISNRSSGRMGFCLADALTQAGAQVYLVSGPTVLAPTLPVYVWEKVKTAQEMFDICQQWWPQTQLGILAAAVADYRIKQISSVKLKKTDSILPLELELNPDILAYLGQHKKENQYLVGFALETDHGLENARKKKEKKNADMMVLNSLEDKGAGFETSTNRITFITQTEEDETSPLETKELIARRILNKIQNNWKLTCWLVLMMLGMGAMEGTSLQAQELNCTVQVMSTKIQKGDKKIFETMQKAFTQFVNGKKWTDLQVGSGEKILCSMTFDIQDRDYNKGLTKAYITVQVRRPVYNSSYNTNLVNILDRDISFTYNEFDPIEFSDNNVSSNLSAVLAYYCYMIIGEYLDSFSLKGGAYCFSRAENVVNMSQAFSESGWKPNERNNRNRYWMIESYMNGNYGDIHQIMYTYHRKGMDRMYENPVEARVHILEALSLFKKLNEIKTGLPCKQLFMESKVDEIISIFLGANQTEKEQVLGILTEIDASNIQKYQKIMNSR